MEVGLAVVWWALLMILRDTASRNAGWGMVNTALLELAWMIGHSTASNHQNMYIDWCVTVDCKKISQVDGLAGPADEAHQCTSGLHESKIESQFDYDCWIFPCFEIDLMTVHA
jgi:hypothetical protein